MDESWDADFDGELRIPENVRDASDSVRSSTHAARDLAQATADLKNLLLTRHSEIPKQLQEEALPIVQASTVNETDPLYKSEAWALLQTDRREIVGNSIEDVLRKAIDVRERIWNAINR